MSTDQTIKVHLRYAGKGKPVMAPSEIILPYEEYEELQAESDRRLALLKEASDVLYTLMNRYPLDERLATEIIEKIEGELAEELK